MKAVGAGLCDYVHNPTGVFSILRAVVGGLHAEFLQGVRKRKRLVDVGVLIYIVAAIELVADRILAGTVYGVCQPARKRLGGALVSSPAARADGARHP